MRDNEVVLWQIVCVLSGSFSNMSVTKIVQGCLDNLFDVAIFWVWNKLLLIRIFWWCISLAEQSKYMELAFGAWNLASA